MNSLQIEAALETLRVNAKVFAANRLPNSLSTPCALVINTDPDTRPGSHWVAVFIDKYKNGEYFDSYGFPPLVESHTKFLTTSCKKWIHNKTGLQSYNTTVCGQYCLLFLYFKVHGRSMREFLKIFPGPPLMNDKIIVKVFNKLFKGVGRKKLPAYPKVQGCSCRRF